MTIVVKGGVIDSILPGFADPVDLVELANARVVEVINLADHVVMPGLIDCHTHITGEYTADIRLRRLEETDADAAVHGVVYARRTLEAGFTTIRNVGSSGDAAFALRDAISAGLIPGPRILVAGESISPTGGHSDATLGYRDDIFAMPDSMLGIADGPAACRKAVRAQVKRGADVIKLTATGGVLSATAAGTEQQFFDDELYAIVQTAHLLGRKVAAHAHGTNGINAALRAGVDSIEHGTFLDDESISLFKKTGAFLVPTILAGKTVTEKAQISGYYPWPVAEKASRVGPVIQGAFARAHRGGVRIAFGTDSGVSAHGDNAREFLLMVEAGMNPADAIVSATINAAELLGLSDTIGTVEPGKAADLIATTGAPLVEISQLQRVVFVMRAGKVYKRP
jgi:imidazolonepropionase-like amidohydrolase